MNGYFALAAFLVIITTGFHCIAGGKRVVRPMLQSADLNNTIKAVLYGCWHAFTLLYVGVAVGFLWAATAPSANKLAVVNTTLSALLAVFSFGVTLYFRQRLLRLPHWILFTGVAVAGSLGLVAA